MRTLGQRSRFPNEITLPLGNSFQIRPTINTYQACHIAFPRNIAVWVKLFDGDRQFQIDVKSDIGNAETTLAEHSAHKIFAV